MSLLAAVPAGSMVDPCCCTCFDRIGDTLEAVFVSVALCAPWSIVSGVNGVFNDVTWNAGTGQWEKIVGVVNDGTDDYDAVLEIACDGTDGCETFTAQIGVPDGPGGTGTIWTNSFRGEGCADPEQFGDAIANLNTVCFITQPACIGINGTGTFDVP